MKPFPEATPLSENPPLSGHLWVQELATGSRLRFQVARSGLISFGVPRRRFNQDEGVPLPYRRAAAHVRGHIDLTALRSAAEDTESVTFFGVATLYEGTEYDWQELPPFLGVDAWSDAQNAYLSPDAAAKAYASLGLSSLPAVEKEAPAEYTDLSGYASGEMPDSEWRDGTAAGVLVRDKSGGRGEAWRAETSNADTKTDTDTDTRTETDTGTVGTGASLEDFVARYVDKERVDATAERVTSAEGTPTVESVLERVVADTVREGYSELYNGDECVFSERALRSAVSERVRRYLG